MTFHTATSLDFETLLKGVKSHSGTLHLGYSQRNYPVCPQHILFKQTQHRASALFGVLPSCCGFGEGHLHQEGRLWGELCESTLLSYVKVLQQTLPDPLDHDRCLWKSRGATVSGHPRTPKLAAEHQLSVFWCGFCQALGAGSAERLPGREMVSQDGYRQRGVHFGENR